MWWMEKWASAQVERGTGPTAEGLQLAKVILAVIQHFLVP